MIDFPVIDSHIHLLDQKRFGYAWAAGAPALKRDWTPDDLDAAAKPYAVEGFVFVEVDVDAGRHVDEAQWIEEFPPATRASRAASPARRWSAARRCADLDRLARLPVVRGVRRLIQNQPDPDFVLRPAFLEALRMLPERNLSFDICVLHHQLPNTLEMARRCPGVRSCSIISASRASRPA